MDKNEIRTRRQELASLLPGLALRVFALADKRYEGSGYHWSLVRSIGGLLRNVNDYDSKFVYEDLIINEVTYEDLVERVDAAEASVVNQIRSA